MSKSLKPNRKSIKTSYQKKKKIFKLSNVKSLYLNRISEQPFLHEFSLKKIYTAISNISFYFYL